MRNLLFILFTLTAPLTAAQNYGNLTVSSLDSVYDGDTFKVTIDELHPLIGKAILVRVAGIDTPELRSKDPTEKALACEARDYAAHLLNNAKNIVLVDVRRDKYFRILADVYLDGILMSEQLIQAGVARPYDGKTKSGWGVAVTP